MVGETSFDVTEGAESNVSSLSFHYWGLKYSIYLLPGNSLFSYSDWYMRHQHSNQHVGTMSKAGRWYPSRVCAPLVLTSLGYMLCRLLLPTHRVNGVGECHDGAADKYTHSAAGMDFNPYQWCRAAVLSLYVLMQFDRRAVENCCEEGRRERLNRGSDAEKEEEKK